MRFNSMTRENDRKRDNSKFYVYAFFLAILSFFVLSVAFDMLVILLKLALKYWWAVLIGGLILLFLRKRGWKK